MQTGFKPVLSLAATVAAAAAIGACGSSPANTSTTAVTTPQPSGGEDPSQLAPVHGAYAPKIDPANFVSQVDNPWFPLKPGTVTRWTGVAEDGKTPQLDIATVTNQTKRIEGVDTTVVRDVVQSNGKPFERTYDWYAQDRAGNVWYFGEDSSDYRNGHWQPSGGSFQAGVDGAAPGIIMPAQPQAGDAYRQEYYPKHALDQAKVVGYRPAKVPYGSFARTLTTVETSALEPGLREQKNYVRGIGETKSQDLSVDHEAFQLVAVKRP
jgi:hypothetical protein